MQALHLHNNTVYAITFLKWLLVRCHAYPPWPIQTIAFAKSCIFDSIIHAFTKLENSMKCKNKTHDGAPQLQPNAHFVELVRT